MKRKNIKPLIKLLLVIFIFFIIIAFVSGYFSIRVKSYIKQKTRLEASNLLSETIKREVLQYINLEDMVKIIKDDNNKIESIFVNTYQVNQISSKVSECLGELVGNLENNELKSLSLPLGVIFSDTLFGNLGPAIKIRIYPIGSITVDVISKCEQYGINNSLLTIYVDVCVWFTSIIPFQREEIEVTTKIPIVVQTIYGEVPRYYYNNRNNDFIPYPIDE